MRLILIMTDYVTSLNIGNCDQLMKTVGQYLSGTPPQRSQIIYLYGMGCNGKTVFLDAMNTVIEKMTGIRTIQIPSQGLSRLSVSKSTLLDHPAKIVEVSEVNHLSDLVNVINVVDQWSLSSHIHRCYFIMSNVAIVEPVLRSKVIYCEFPQTLTPCSWTDQHRENAIESVTNHLKLHMTNKT